MSRLVAKSGGLNSPAQKNLCSCLDFSKIHPFSKPGKIKLCKKRRIIY